MRCAVLAAASEEPWQGRENMNALLSPASSEVGDRSVHIAVGLIGVELELNRRRPEDEPRRSKPRRLTQCAADLPESPPVRWSLKAAPANPARGGRASPVEEVVDKLDDEALALVLRVVPNRWGEGFPVSGGRSGWVRPPGDHAFAGRIGSLPDASRSWIGGWQVGDQPTSPRVMASSSPAAVSWGRRPTAARWRRPTARTRHVTASAAAPTQ